ncbi:MAG: hypothetical protein KatS3mg021_2443 [Fimbriimonadales bacterium]|nr:MAG: hypothetical protein KatS3mg021_2443 [Fimbriimonadales bacterium]
MLDLVLLFGFAVAVLALALAWLRWKQTRVITPTAGFLVCSIFFVQIGFIYFYYEYDGVESARTALLNTSVGVLSVAVSIMLGLSWIERRSKVYRISHLPAGYPLSVYIAVACVLIALTLVYFLLIGYVPLIAAFYSLLTEGWSQGLLNRLRVSRDIYVNPQANYVPLQGFFEIIRYVGMVIIFMWAIHLRRIGFNRFLSGMLLASAFLLPVFAGAALAAATFVDECVDFPFVHPQDSSVSQDSESSYYNRFRARRFANRPTGSLHLSFGKDFRNLSPRCGDSDGAPRSGERRCACVELWLISVEASLSLWRVLPTEPLQLSSWTSSQFSRHILPDSDRRLDRIYSAPRLLYGSLYQFWISRNLYYIIYFWYIFSFS